MRRGFGGLAVSRAMVVLPISSLQDDGGHGWRNQIYKQHGKVKKAMEAVFLSGAIVFGVSEIVVLLIALPLVRIP